MMDRDIFVEETQRQIETLGTSSVRLTLMAVNAPSLPAPVLEATVRTAAAPLDMVGPMGDGSLGLLSLRSLGPDGGAGVEQRFLMKMQTVLAPLARRRPIGIIRFRAVHRWACELTDAIDLFDSLFDAPSVVLAVPAAQPSWNFSPRPLAPHVASLLFPWHSPRARNPARNDRP